MKWKTRYRKSFARISEKDLQATVLSSLFRAGKGGRQKKQPDYQQTDTNETKAGGGVSSPHAVLPSSAAEVDSARQSG